MKKYILRLAAVVVLGIACLQSMAQIVTTSPSPLQENSENVILTYHADSDLGNKQLAGLSQNAAVYAHIGVITNKSTSGSDWKYAPQWCDNAAKYKLKYVSANTWSLEIGDIRSYFGINDDNEIVKKIALVFRDAKGNKQGKTASNGDIFVDVAQAGFQVALSSNLSNDVLFAPTTAKFTLTATVKSNLSIEVNGKSIASATGVKELVADYKFDAIGDYAIVGKGQNGNETVENTLYVSYPRASVEAAYPGDKPLMGVHSNAKGEMIFCIAAPEKSNVVIVPSWDDYKVLSSNVMDYHTADGVRYFWKNMGQLPTDKYLPYYYLVDGKKVGDPCATLVLDAYNDKYLDSAIWPDMPQYPYDVLSDVPLAVYCGKLHDYTFSNFEIPAHDNLIIYELLLRDFTGTEGKSLGNGTLAQAMQKIPYLKRLGVNAIELMPIMEFNGNNSWGYNTNFYMAPDKAYGSPIQYKQFIEECHANGMAVILDIVFNQSDGLHPWYQMYDIKKNPFYNATAPHDYSVLNDWNQDNAVLQQHWVDVIKYWLEEYNVDGFRFDLVKGLGANNSYGSGTNGYNASRVANMKRLHAAIKEVKADGIHINENLAGAKEENEMGADGQLNWSNVNNASCQYAMGWTDGIGDVKGFYAPNWSRTAGTTVAYAESHDEERMGYKQKQWATPEVKSSQRAKMDRLGAVAVQMLMAPGAKMIWQFGELGADQTTKNNSGNDTSPKTVVWSYADDDERAALLDTYTQMCNLRTLNPDLFAADANYTATSISSLTTHTAKIKNGNKEAVAFVNGKVSGGASKVAIATQLLTADNCKLVAASAGFNGQLMSDNGQVYVMLQPNQYAVFSNEATSGEGSIFDDLDNAPKAYGGRGEIIVVGDYSTLDVYSIDGASLGSTLSVAPGTYIVVIDGNATKVLVR